MATSNLASFQLDLANFAKVTVPEKHGLVVKKIAFMVLQGCIFKTPVDTGRARANWSVTIGKPATFMTEGVDKSGGQTVQLGMNTIREAKPLKDVIWISNNVPYITALEDGHSQQAPAGMVETTLHEIQDFVNKI